LAKTVSGMPAGERARKRRAAQAAFLRGASRTPLVCGHQDNASAGVPLSFIYCRGRVDKKRFVDETASTAPRRQLRGFVVLDPQNSDAKTAPRERFPIASLPDRKCSVAVSRAQCGTSAFTRVFDALWLKRSAAPADPGSPQARSCRGPRISGAAFHAAPHPGNVSRW
jgi:hypothetical protein